MSHLPVGSVIKIHELDDAPFSIWSPADEGPGAYFAVPVDAQSPVKYAVIRAMQRSYEAHPMIELLRTEYR